MTFDDIVDSIKVEPFYLDREYGQVIYCGDCREILPDLPKVDLVLTDPPYGVNLDLTWLESVNKKRLPSKSIDKIIGDDGSLNLDLLFDYPKWIIFGFPYIFSNEAIGWLVWDKQPGLMDTDRTITTPVEMALTNCWKGFRLVRCMWAGYMRDNGEHRFAHPTQKPQKVISYCINKASELGDIILDPFLGSGTTAYCAKKLGRKCIGIEIEEKYCEIAKNRLSQSVMRLEL
uniref:Putative methyltransferase n=1 Tax=viral metagenome TaxID=1070528 RepID=A0A6M3KHE6_9ZZZZ